MIVHGDQRRRVRTASHAIVAEHRYRGTVDNHAAVAPQLGVGVDVRDGMIGWGRAPTCCSRFTANLIHEAGFRDREEGARQGHAKPTVASTRDV